MSKVKYADMPLVYSCSGCSSIAQLANRVAVELDREGKAEMSCIAGVGGGVMALVKKALSGRPIVALDGCPLQCVKECLDQQGIEATQHHILTEYGVKKIPHGECTESEVQLVKERVLRELETIT